MYYPPKRRKLTPAERREVHNKCRGHCAYCGEELAYKNMHVDHVQPISVCGSDTLDNILPACRSCDHYKSSLTLEDFRSYVSSMPCRLHRDSVTYRNAVRFGMVIHNPQTIRFYFEKMEGTP
jgi:hypothetical protein